MERFVLGLLFLIEKKVRPVGEVLMLLLPIYEENFKILKFLELTCPSHLCKKTIVVWELF